MGAVMYFDDFAVGQRLAFGSHEVEAAEMLAFARQWDPLPIHTDPHSEAARRHGGIIASGEYTLAVKQKLLTGHPMAGSVIGAVGWDELRFPNPVRAGDRLTLNGECLDLRPSRSKPDRGIVVLAMAMAADSGQPVLSYIDTVMLARRPEPPEEI